MTHDDSKLEKTLDPDGLPEGQVDSVVEIADPALNEDSALALLQRADLQPEWIENLSKSAAVNSRKVKLAIVRHPKTARYVSLSLLRKLFTFDLMRVALTPVVASDLKMAAEGVLISRMETISAGEKLSLAHRASGRVASALLLDNEPRVVTVALENPRLTEVLLTKAVLSERASPVLIQSICTHPKWQLRTEIRMALLRNEHTPAQSAVEFAKSLPNEVVEEILQNSKVPENVKTCLTRGDQ